jgi:hypothetical protein
MGFFKNMRGSDPVPDFYFAAKAFTQVAITRQYAPEMDLEKLPVGIAMEFLEVGTTREQALSAHWGAILAVDGDLMMFDLALRRGKQEAAEAGWLPETDKVAEKVLLEKIHQRAADYAVRCVWEADRKAYGRFLHRIEFGGLC